MPQISAKLPLVRGGTRPVAVTHEAVKPPLSGSRNGALPFVGLELMSYTGKVGRFAWLSLRLTYASKHRAIDCFLGLLIQLRTVKRGA